MLFSSGSSLFNGMIDGVNLASKCSDKYNLVLVGIPLEEEYLDSIDKSKVIYAGYINWISHLFKYADLAVLTDDGVSLQEAIASKIPIVTLTKIKWGRYQNMAGVYKGAIIESEVSDVCKSIEEAFDNYDSIKSNVLKYSDECLAAGDILADKMIKKIR